MYTETILFCLALIGIPCLVWGLPRLFSRNKGEMTARATILSHRVEVAKFASRKSGYNYLVAFDLGGDTLELYTTEEEYHALTDGQRGQLTWEKDLFYHFEPDDLS